MITGQLVELLSVTGGTLTGTDCRFSGVSTDSRTLLPGNLFLALQGPKFDGHAYLEEAAEKGAAGCLVASLRETGLPQVVVRDTKRALGDIANWWRRKFISIPLIGVTGSNGKTTVKEMLASIFSSQGEVLATIGNLNNEIGVPLTLMNLNAQHRAAVVEMGANHMGEITRLTMIAEPTVGVVNNAAEAHLEGFGSVEGVARGKGELYAALPLQSAAVLNLDDPHHALWQAAAANRSILGFGLENARADVYAKEIRSTSVGVEFELVSPQGTAVVKLDFPGKHNVMNALSAASAAYLAGIPLPDIADGLCRARPAGGRLNRMAGIHDTWLINDTYNANPASLAAGLSVLADHAGPRWLVLGDMAELGESAQAWHVRAGELARQAGVTRLWAIGELATQAADAFGEGGFAYTDIETLVRDVSDALQTDVCVLIKGSRTMSMERVVERLAAPNPVQFSGEGC